MSDTEVDIVDVADADFDIEGDVDEDDNVTKKGRGKDIYLEEFGSGIYVFIFLLQFPPLCLTSCFFFLPVL